jgi:hypothetical protein
MRRFILVQSSSEATGVETTAVERAGDDDEQISPDDDDTSDSESESSMPDVNESST